MFHGPSSSRATDQVLRSVATGVRRAQRLSRERRFTRRSGMPSSIRPASASRSSAADATAGHYIAQLTASAASVTVFAHPPRRIVDELPWPTTRAKRWLGRQLRPASRGRRSRPALVKSAISAITPSGIRTSDGVDHHADAIIYGTGFAVPDQDPDTTLVGAGGLSIQQAWDDGTEPFLGVATHGFPNYFLITGPDARRASTLRRRMRRADEAHRQHPHRSTSQQPAGIQRARPRPNPRSLSRWHRRSTCHRAPPSDETYDGMATLTIAGTCHPVRVRLAGHLDPIDGHYHWQGTLFSSPAQPLPG